HPTARVRHRREADRRLRCRSRIDRDLRGGRRGRHRDRRALTIVRPDHAALPTPCRQAGKVGAAFAKESMMKKAIVFAATFAAGSALAQVGTWSGGGAGGSGAMSNLGADGRFGAGPQIPTADMRATG